jgi:surface protein
MNNWDVSNVTNMGYMFTSCYSFDGDIGNWDVSNVTNMESMLSSTSFNNGGSSSINNWNVSGVTTMEGMFANSNFNQPISGWNVSNVQIMGTMFSGAFNQPIGNWDVSNVFFMGGMFGSGLFNQDIGNWNISGVTEINNFMVGKTPLTFSTTNLDAIYNGWSTKNPQTGLSINFGSANYTSASSAGKAILTGSTLSGGYNWTIIDGGQI